MADLVSILLVSGSLRAASTNAAVVRTIAAEPPAGLRTLTFPGLGDLPHFNPDDDGAGSVPHPAVATLRAAVHEADAVLFCTPEYAGALPGSFKNLLEWLVGDADPRSISGKPAGWINAAGAAAPTGAADAHGSLRKVLTYVGAQIVEPACVRVPIDRRVVDDQGLIADAQVAEAVRSALRPLVAAVHDARG